MTRLSEELIALLEKAIVEAPYASLLGIELVDAEEDRLRLRLPYRSELTTFGDTVHGGAIAGLVDAAATARRSPSHW